MLRLPMRKNLNFRKIKYLIYFAPLLFDVAKALDFNLVIDPGFEFETGYCPYGERSLMRSKAQGDWTWEGTDSELFRNGCHNQVQSLADPNDDYKKECDYTLPNRHPTNKSYAGFLTLFKAKSDPNPQGFGRERIEYVGGELKDFLLPNVEYEISYDLSTPNNAFLPTHLTRLNSVSLAFRDEAYDAAEEGENYKSYSETPPNDPISFFSPNKLTPKNSLQEITSINDVNPFIGLENGEYHNNKWYTAKGKYHYSSSQNSVNQKKYILLGNFFDVDQYSPLPGVDFYKLGNGNNSKPNAYYIIDNVKITCHPKVALQKIPATLHCEEDFSLLGEAISNTSLIEWKISKFKDQFRCSALSPTPLVFNSQNKQTTLNGLLSEFSSPSVPSLTPVLKVKNDEFVRLSFGGICHNGNTKSPAEGIDYEFKFQPTKVSLELHPSMNFLECGDDPIVKGNITDGTHSRLSSYVGMSQNFNNIQESTNSSIDTSIGAIVSTINSNNNSKVKLKIDSQTGDFDTLTIGLDGKCGRGYIQNDYEGGKKVELELRPPVPFISEFPTKITCRDLDRPIVGLIENNRNLKARHFWNISVNSSSPASNGSYFTNTKANNPNSYPAKTTLRELLNGHPVNINLVGAKVKLEYGSLCQTKPMASDELKVEKQFIIEQEKIDLLATGTASNIEIGGNIKVFNLQEAVTFNLPESIKNSLQDFNNITWTIYDSNNKAILNIPHQGAGPFEFNFGSHGQGSYRVEVIFSMKDSQFKCDMQASMNLFLLNDVHIYAPNVFNPDGSIQIENKSFRVFANKGFEDIASDYSLKIFARNGGMVFESNNLSDTWDGSINKRGIDTPLTPQVFTYVATYQLNIAGKKIPGKTSGDITLIR
jgi:hypothetical protein